MSDVIAEPDGEEQDCTACVVAVEVCIESQCPDIVGRDD
jgi:hypothetical protein